MLSDCSSYYKYNNIITHLCKISFGPLVSGDGKIIRALWAALPLFEKRLNSGDPIHMKIAFEVASSLDINVNEMKTYDERKRCFEAALVLLLSTREEGQKLQWHDTDTFLDEYPDFRCIHDPNEIEKLLNFRNLVRVALALLPARNKKTHIIDLVTKITEGKGAKDALVPDRMATKLRVAIFDHEKDCQNSNTLPTIIKKNYATITENVNDNDNDNLNDISEERTDVDISSTSHKNPGMKHSNMNNNNLDTINNNKNNSMNNNKPLHRVMSIENNNRHPSLPSPPPPPVSYHSSDDEIESPSSRSTSTDKSNSHEEGAQEELGASQNDLSEKLQYSTRVDMSTSGTEVRRQRVTKRQ